MALTIGGFRAWLSAIPFLGWATWGVLTRDATRIASGTGAIGKILSDQPQGTSPNKERDLERRQ